MNATSDTTLSASPNPSAMQSTFHEALLKYISDLPPAKQKKDFIMACYDPTAPKSQEMAFTYLRQLEVAEKAAHAGSSSKFSKAIRKVVSACKDYDEVIKSFASADPMPSALIWGALSIFINAAHRHHELWNQINDHLQRMAGIIERLGRYEPLWGECPKFQRLLFESYICILRFFSRVYKELSKSAAKTILSSVLSKCLRKLDGILTQLKQSEENIKNHIQILEGENARKDRDYQHNWRLEEHKKTLTEWLGKQEVTSANHKRFEELKGDQMPGTFPWMDEISQIRTWLDGSSDAESRILPLYAPPGCGKSTFCAHAIQSLLQKEASTPVAYHFYRFFKQVDAGDILRHFASQLFCRYVSSARPNPADLETLSQIVGDETISARSRAEQLLAKLVESFPTVWLFLDGLDEELHPDRWREASRVVHFLLELSASSLNVRLWSSSQNIDCVSQAFKGYDLIDVGDAMRQDMATFLTNKARDLNLSDESRALILSKSDENRAGCFLWAHLMIRDLEAAISPADQKRIIVEGPTLDEYYSRFFKRLSRADWLPTCRIFALVTFARRPLRIRELREAVAILENKGSHRPGNTTRNLSEDQLPYASKIKQLCSPLIIFSDDGEGDQVCYLYHSALLRFLERNPNALCDLDQSNFAMQLCPSVIADACILYLSQERYSHPLQKKDINGVVHWTDINESPVHSHLFLSYAAKYWDKHLDLSINPGAHPGSAVTLATLRAHRTPEMVIQFLASSNFKTCLQAQSLLVNGQFVVYFGSPDVPFMVFKRVFPDWLESEAAHISRWDYSNGYREYCREWCRLLDPSSVADENRWKLAPYHGEVDRCWWGALGVANFLSNFQGAHISFRFEKMEACQSSVCSAFSISDSGDRVEIVNVCVHGDTISVHAGQWTLSTSGFNLAASDTFTVKKDGMNLEQYTPCEQCLGPHRGRARLLDSNAENGTIRIGTEVYIRLANGALHCADVADLGYVEETSSRGPFLALATRHRRLGKKAFKSIAPESSCSKNKPMLLDDLDDEDLRATINQKLGDTSGSEVRVFLEGIFGKNPPDCVDSSQDITSTPSKPPAEAMDSSDEDWSSDTSSGDESEDEIDDAYESWSECSSEAENNSSFDAGRPGRTPRSTIFEAGDDDGVTLGSTPESSEDEGGDSSGRSSPTESESGRSTRSSSSSASDVAGIDRRQLAGCQLERYGEAHISSDEEEAYCGEYMRSLKRRKEQNRRSPLLARLRVVDTRSPESPQELFHFSMALEWPLYDSPPTFHPNHSLVIWPLSGGQILFGDFEYDSYFIRRLKPSTSHTRHISMKCRFSECGSFLHVAVLEGQFETSEKRKEDSEEQTMSLAMVVHTFRLCSSQPTRTPPTLRYKSRVDLCHSSKLSTVIHELPLTLTWREKFLYVTDRSVALKVYRVSLFPPKEETNEFPVFRPEKTIPLPNSALRRDVHFFPPNEGDDRAWIILGVDPLYSEGSPPIGCFLDEVKDLGGWVRSSGTQDVPNPRGDGHLILPKENFDPEEDCDLEPFLFLD